MTLDGVKSWLLAAAAICVLASGILLTRFGKPYGTVLLNVHKLVDLAALIFVGVAAFQANRQAALPSATSFTLLAATLLMVATLATGGVISAVSSAPSWALWMHRVGSWAAVAATAAGVYLVVTR